jgi:hypothetical protein
VTAPITPPWDGDPRYLVEQAAARLTLGPTDPDLPWLGQLADAVVDQVRQYLDSPAADPLAEPVPAPVTVASILALVEAYKRKDATFGITGAWSGDGVALRISRDWLDGVKTALQPYRVKFGVA